MTNLVCGVICSRVFHLNQNKGMEEIGSDHVRHKRCGLLLKNCSHNVIPNVTLPLDLFVGKYQKQLSAYQLCQCWNCVDCDHSEHLLHVSLSIGQFGGDVKHEFLSSEHSVDRLRPCLTVRHVQTTSKPEYKTQSEN